MLAGDIPTEIARLRRESGDEMQVLGSNQQVQTLIRHGLVDEYRLMVPPLMLGRGKRLFAEMDRPVR